MNRRIFLKQTIIAPTAGFAILSLPTKGAEPTDVPQKPATNLPKGKIGKLEVSRVLLGGNLLTHFTHSRDLRYVYNLAAKYNTDEKILETLSVAEKNGINTLSIHTVPHALSLMQRYRKERGGKIQWIICPTAPIKPDMEEYSRAVEELASNGTEAIYLWGVHSDSLAAQNKIDLIAKAVEVPHKFGLPSGVGAHSLDVVKLCEKNGINADFYIKTFHHHNYPTGPRPDEIKGPYEEYPGYWCANPKETAEFMKDVKKPWIAFKVMAAGAIPPKNAFRFVFSNGADFVLAGMFDFEIAEDVQTAVEVLSSVKDRARPWQA